MTFVMRPVRTTSLRNNSFQNFSSSGVKHSSGQLWVETPDQELPRFSGLADAAFASDAEEAIVRFEGINAFPSCPRGRYLGKYGSTIGHGRQSIVRG